MSTLKGAFKLACLALECPRNANLQASLHSRLDQRATLTVKMPFISNRNITSPSYVMGRESIASYV